MSAYNTAFDQLYSDARAGNTAAATAQIQSQMATSDRLMASLATLTSSARTRALGLSGQIQTTYDQARLLSLLILVIAVIAGLFVSIRVSAGIRNGVMAVQTTLTSLTDVYASALEAGLGALSQNDLTVEVHPETSPIEKYGTDEIGQTAAITNRSSLGGALFPFVGHLRRGTL